MVAFTSKTSAKGDERVGDIQILVLSKECIAEFTHSKFLEVQQLKASPIRKKGHVGVGSVASDVDDSLQLAQ
jgi:hypothetical protein